MNNDNDIVDLANQLSKTEEDLKKANETLKSLQEEKEKKNNITLIKDDNYDILKEQNEELELIHILLNEDIKKYKENLLKLKEEVKTNEKKILALKGENVKLKKKNKVDKEDIKENYNKNVILNIKDLRESTGFKFLKDSSKEPKEIENENNMDTVINNNEEMKKEYLELIKKKKEEFCEILSELKNKSNLFNDIINKQTETINEERNYLIEILQSVSDLREKANISDNNSNNFNDNIEEKIDEINIQFDKSFNILFQLEDIIFKINNTFGNNIENLLADIQTNVDNLDKNENKISFDNICNETNNNINEIKKIFFDLEKIKVNFDSKNNNIKDEINKLKILEKNLKDYDKNKKQNEPNINNINKNNFINKNNDNKIVNQIQISYNQIIEDKNSKIRSLGTSSFLYKVKEVSLKLDSYKSENLFRGSEEDLLEAYIDEEQLLRKNYHEICYIYDDYDLFDIYYDLKAVGLSEGIYFPKSIHRFDYDKIIEIQSFLINNIPSKYLQKKNIIEFDIKLYNFDSIRVHIIYKSKKDLSKLSKGKIEERSIFRSDYYGISRSLAGQKAKFSLILKGSFDIVNFGDYFLIRNTNNKNEVEYVWGGRVPYQGKRTLIMFSRKEAIWSFKHLSKYHGDNFIKRTNFYAPIKFIGGNNEIINIFPTSFQSTNIIIDEEKRRYIVEFTFTKYKDFEFIIEGKLKNKCKGEWEVDITDKEVEKRIPKSDKLTKPQLRLIAEKIIDEFDKNNKNNDFEYLDYMKIGLWVFKNIKYDYNYSGKMEYTSIDIYNMRAGVCHHFTQLSNALLYALGYKVIFVSGYACQNGKSFKTNKGHSWSLIKLEDNKWYPFDSTWGIFTGKLPVSHIFGSFFDRKITIGGIDRLTFDKYEMEGKFIES